ncbi:MAG: YggT family protein [Thiohalomonadaceae bacterium]
MQGYLLSPVEFVLTTVFQLYIMLVMVRFLLQWLKADFYNPISQFVVKVTNPPLLPLRRIIPGWGGIDVAAIVLMVLLQLLSLFLVLWLRDKGMALETLLLWSLAELIGLGINVFLFAIIIQVIISWVNPGQYNPITAILASLTEPLLRPARRLLPPISGIDLSPLLALLALQVLKMLIVPPLMHLALAG